MSFRDLLAAAVQYFTLHGFAEPHVLAQWMARLRDAALGELPTPKQVDDHSRRAMEATFKRALTYAALKRRHPDVSRYTIDRIKPQLRDELTKRVMANAELIKLNRQAAIEKTLQRFSGWATSVPEGGSRITNRTDVKEDVIKSLKQLKYEERRCNIDQGHKLVAAIDAVVAKETGAVAMKWRSHWRDSHYDYRPDHKERDGKFYAIRGSWAAERGLINKGAGYADDMTQPGEEVYCRCYAVYVTGLRGLPDDMLTAKGREEYERARVKAA